jgi:hypothetical protein
MNTYRIKFVTPLFSRGAYEDRPEVRAASIRGQLHWWFRILGASSEDEKIIFGGVHGGASASKIIIRVSGVNGSTFSVSTLPHKSGGHASPKVGYEAGTAFDLYVLERLGGLPPRLQPAWHRALESWLLAGSLGLRATRGGGSIHWSDAPGKAGEFRTKLAELLNGASLGFDLLGRVFTKAEDARRVITETIAHPALQDISYPLGAVKQSRDDPAPSRKTSPLRLTIRHFEDGFRILAIWDDRQFVTGNTRGHLHTAIERLANGTPQSKPTEIGKLLQQSSLS